MEEKKTIASLKKRFYAALVGTVVVAVCCFTPVLVILFAVRGLSAFTHYLDYVLYPALVILIVLTVYSYRKWKKLEKQQCLSLMEVNHEHFV